MLSLKLFHNWWLNFIFSCDIIIVKVKDSILGLRNTMEIKQTRKGDIDPIFHWSIINNDWKRINITTQKKLSLGQNSPLHNQTHYIINQKYLKNERVKNLNFPYERQKDKSIDTLLPFILLEGEARHFKNEYMIKFSKINTSPINWI